MPLVVEHLPHLVDQARVAQLARGDVDEHVDRPAPFGEGPADGLPARLLEDPAAERLEQPALLGDREELGGTEQAVVGVVPAQQGLGPEDRAGPQVDDGLEVEQELVALDAAAQGLLGGEPCDDTGPEVVVEHLDAVATPALGHVHGGVGVAQQLARLLVSGGDDHADADRHVHLRVAHVDQACGLLEDAVGEQRWPSRVPRPPRTR